MVRLFPRLELRKKDLFTHVGLSITVEDANSEESIVAIETLNGVMEFAVKMDWVNKTAECFCFTDPSGVKFAFEIDTETGQEIPIQRERREQNLLLFNFLRETMDKKGAL